MDSNTELSVGTVLGFGSDLVDSIKVIALTKDNKVIHLDGQPSVGYVMDGDFRSVSEQEDGKLSTGVRSVMVLHEMAHREIENPIKYYYIAYMAIARSGSKDNLYCEAVESGNISDIILRYKGQQREDKYYHAYMITFFKEITREDYNKLDGHIG